MAQVIKEPKDFNSNSELKRKVEPEAILVNMFGDLIKFSKKSAASKIPFRKYDYLATSLVAVPKEQRFLLYAFVLGLGLTAHARRLKDSKTRKEIFALKNELFLSIANNFSLRRMLNFRHCQSKRFKVTNYCSSCLAANSQASLPQRMWKFCQNCTIDREYYNVLSMFHKFPDGGASLFLGNELISEVKGLKILKKLPIEKLDEEIRYKRYAFSPKNLIALDLQSLTKTAHQLLAQIHKLAELSPQVDEVKSYIATGGNKIVSRKVTEIRLKKTSQQD